ncbi:MAG: NAD(P)/FAD-dependent oxidoreductase [Paracoccaceae bacterium]|nr:NAD(P)/FAD-dependent oxidoreductase [Paracoccaceae bacterium]
MGQIDHLIVGSGINALVAGALLARKGKKVLLVERAPRAGGCMVTTEATLEGFHNDVIAATFVLFLTSPAYGELAKDVERHGFELCHSPHPTAMLRPNGRATVLTMDRAANVATFNALSPKDGDQNAADVCTIEDDAPFLFALLGGDLWSWKTAKLMAGQVWSRGVNGLKAWIDAALVLARGWLEASYTSLDLQALWAPWVLHTGLTPEANYSGQMGKVIAFALEAAGAPVVKGGAGNAVAAFCSLIEEFGGSIRTGVDVERILVENNRAIGVRTTEGETIFSGSVLASVTPSQLYDRLLDGHQTAQVAQASDIKAFRHGRGNFQMHYALDRPPKWRAAGLDDVALIHLADGIDSVPKSANEAERGMLPQTPTICVGQPHRLDPTRCAEGKAILWLQIPDSPRVIKGDAAGQIETTSAWDEVTRELYADRIESILSAHIQDFASIKMPRHAYSPADLDALNINLVGGDPYGGQCTIDQFFIFRPFPSSRNDATNLRNLYHIGASTHPGPGLGGGSGYNTAKRLGG